MFEGPASASVEEDGDESDADVPAAPTFSSWEEVVDLGMALLDVPVLHLTLVDGPQRYHSVLDEEDDCEARSIASRFGAHVAQAGKQISILDAADESFNFPVAPEEGPIRFYAGTPIVGADDAVHGALCVLDREARTSDEGLLRSLDQLRSMVAQRLSLQKERAARKEAEARLRRVNAKYQAVVENVHDALFLVGIQQGEDGLRFPIRGVNAAHEAITGLSTDAIRGQTPRDIFGEELGKKVEAHYRRCVEERDVIEYEEELPFPKRDTRWRTRLSPIFVEGDITHLLGVSREISKQKTTQRQLQESNQRLQLALDAAGAGTFAFDVQANQVEWDERTLEIYGIDDDFRRVEASELYQFVHPEDEAHLRDVFHGAIEVEDRYEVTYRIRRPDGEERVVHSQGIVERKDNGTAERVIGINQDITEQRELQREVLAISDQERRRIGQHLHDTLGGQLSGARMMVQNLVDRIERGTELSASKGRQLAELLQDAEEKVRRLSHSLMPMDSLDKRLPEALHSLCERREQMIDGCCSIVVDESIPELNTEVETHLYRIAAEAVTNAVKHAEPDEIVLALRGKRDTIELIVQDDGTGITEEEIDREGAGLRIMRYRSALIGASLQVKPAEEEGTIVCCSLSLTDAQRAPSHLDAPLSEGVGQ